MLDVHALTITPGAVLVLGADGAVSAGGDGCSSPGVPVNSAPGRSRLRMWGFNSATADSIAAIRLRSQDMINPIDGISVTPGAASLLLQYYDYTTIPYVKGTRSLNLGTNVGVVAGNGFLIDEVQAGQCVDPPMSAGNETSVGLTTFGAALAANTWGTQPWLAPNLPAGKYAILGSYTSAHANVATIRFRHPDFGGYAPGYPTCNYELAVAATGQVAMRDELVQTAHGEQFMELSKRLGVPCCPVFTVGNAGTGLQIDMIAAQAATPVVDIIVMKVG
jgi:hypothetical protein